MNVTDSRLLQLIEPVAGELEAMREILRGALTPGSDAVRELTDHIGSFQGKQLRGTLVLLVGRALDRLSPEHPKVAAIVELIHLATLVHDDVLDGAEIRRRVACVNERWDNQIAVLLGDFLYARAFGLSTELSSRVCSRLLAEATQRICSGEIEQAAKRYDFEMSQAVYERIAAAKTATLYSAACELGAGYPAETDELGEALELFGREIGLAFQIIDDCLDLVGEQAIVGKSVGNDVEDGKVTLAVLHTYARADEVVRARIRDAYTLPGLERRVVHLREAADLEAGLGFARARAEELVRSALGRLAALPESTARRNLEYLGSFVLGRNW